MERFYIASTEEILSGKVTDAYFVRTMQVLKQHKLSRHVVMEIRAPLLPKYWPWAVFAGLEELIFLLKNIGRPVEFYSLDEGTLFRPGDPVGYLIGDYQDICIYETALLGLISQASGIATRAARCVKAAQGRAVLSFGSRRVHPAIAPMVDRNAYLGGCQGFSSVLTADQLGISAAGTMPHSIVMLVGDAVETAQLFDEVIGPQVPRLCLVDTLQDEKFEAVRVAEAMGDRLYGIRLDTPPSRRGNFVELIQEVRWELDLRGHQRVRIVVSGGINEERILELNPYCYGYGVGTAISNAPALDYSLDIIEIEGTPFAKRGKQSGRKRLLDPKKSFNERKIVPYIENDPNNVYDLLTLKIKDGQPLSEHPPITEVRERVLAQLGQVHL